MDFLSDSSAKTKKVGRVLGKKVLYKKGVIFIALYGDLGSGKTTFLKGFAEGIEVKEEVTSPTFLIYKKYKAGKGKDFYHFDAYRIKGRDLSLLNFKEKMESNSIIATEWSENIEEKIPKSALKIYFSFINPKKRKLIAKGNSGIMEGSFL